ncbi:MAG TPA: hypothetical protein VE987_20210 [Polyangiaceae bacterium]|nr:hypothetical protein [Polyangiaceae bacterium]
MKRRVGETSGRAGEGQTPARGHVPLALRWCAAVALACAPAVSIEVACGGTNGREDLPMDSVAGDATTVGDAADSGVAPGADAAGDAAVDVGNGAFDVVIVYADRELPDVGTTPGAGDAEAGSAWPNCPPFIPVRNGRPATLMTYTDQIPSDYDDAGNVVPARDGGACATYPWLGSVAADHCTTSNSGDSFVLLPPCNWCVDAGAAVQGPHAGEPRYSICMRLYSCMMQSGCGGNGLTCLCGSEDPTTTCPTDPHPPGPCADLEMGALEETPATLQDAVQNFLDTDPAFTGSCGSLLNALFASAVSDGCLADAGGD